MIERLKEQARAVVTNSYSPYSQFRVAAVVLDSDGNTHAGVNVENASYGLTICAERSAIAAAVAAGAKNIETLVIYTPTQEPTAPCGACRQVIREFSDRARVLSFCDSKQLIDSSIDKLLPGAFQLE